MASTPPGSIQQALSDIVRLSSAEKGTAGLGNLPEGKVLDLLVRSAPETGNGTLVFEGNSIKAALPANLEAGDQIRAKIEKQGDTLVLRLLEISKPTQPLESLQQALLSNLSSQLEDTLKILSSTVFDKSIDLSIQIPPTLATTEAATTTTSVTTDTTTPLQNLTAALAQLETALSAQSAAPIEQRLIQLTASENSTIPNLIRSTSAAILEFVNSLGTASTPNDYLQLIHSQLSEILGLGDVSIAEKIASLETFGQSLAKDLSGTKHTFGSETSRIIKQLMNAVEQASDNPEQSTPILEGALNQLSKGINSIGSQLNSLDPKAITQLKELATHLEQIAATYEMLVELGPVMQALGEPILLLFPFVFQGLLSQAQISIDPEKKKSSKKKDNKDPYQRIQLYLPLPNLGPVQVDIGVREKEILLKLVVERKDTAQFLDEMVVELESTLRKSDFSLESYSTTVSESIDKPDLIGKSRGGSKPFIA